MLDHAYDLGEELTRKAGDAYSWLDNEYKRGQLSDSTMYQALVALDMALLGLIPKEYSEWANIVRTSLPHSEPEKVRSFISDERTVILKLHRVKGEIEVISVPRELGAQAIRKFVTSEEEPDVQRWAEEHFKRLTYGLINKGFKEL